MITVIDHRGQCYKIVYKLTPKNPFKRLLQDFRSSFQKLTLKTLTVGKADGRYQMNGSKRYLTLSRYSA
jgi:hypothetical protein